METTEGRQNKFQSLHQLSGFKSKVWHAGIAYKIRQKYLENSKIILKINSPQKNSLK